MCYGCYEEYGLPAIISPITRSTAELIKILYTREIVGGDLHIVTDDWNIEDSNIDYCIAAVNKNADGRSRETIAIERRIIKSMKAMNMDERASTLALADGYLIPA